MLPDKINKWHKKNLYHKIVHVIVVVFVVNRTLNLSLRQTRLGPTGAMGTQYFFTFCQWAGNWWRVKIRECGLGLGIVVHRGTMQSIVTSVSVCLSARISQRPSPNFTKFFILLCEWMYAKCGHYSTSVVCNAAIRYVSLLPVLWVTDSCVNYIMGPLPALCMLIIWPRYR